MMPMSSPEAKPQTQIIGLERIGRGGATVWLETTDLVEVVVAGVHLPAIVVPPLGGVESVQEIYQDGCNYDRPEIPLETGEQVTGDDGDL